MDNLPKTKQELDQLIQQGINTYMVQKQFNYSKIPAHEHNGVDTIKINAKNIEFNNKYTTFWSANSTETQVIKLPNISSIRIYGYIANAGPTVRATINGETQFGSTLYFQNATGSPTTTSTNGIIQCSNSICIDINTINNTRVTSTNLHLAYPTDSSGSPLIQIDVVSWSPSSVTLSIVSIRAGYTLKAALIIT